MRPLLLKRTECRTCFQALDAGCIDEEERKGGEGEREEGKGEKGESKQINVNLND